MMAKFMLRVFYHNQKNFLNVRQCARELDGAGRGSEDDSEGLACAPRRWCKALWRSSQMETSHG